MIPFLKPVLNKLKNTFIIFIVFSSVIMLFLHFINKDKIALTSTNQQSMIEQNRAEIYKVINDKKLNSTPEGKAAVSAYRLAMCKIVGEACTNNPKDADKHINNSMVGFISKALVMPFANPPASGVYWAYTGLQNAGFIPQTYASEGIGFAAIKPFAGIWKVFRDLSYMLLVLVLIAIGFMVMFRAKLNPQTVITVENALPRIVIAIILITFSFAIAGFMIDLMYIISGLIVSVLSKDSTGRVLYDAPTFTNEYFMSGPWDLLTRDVRVRISGFNSVGNMLGNAFASIMPLGVNLIARTILGIILIFLAQFAVNYFADTTAKVGGLSNVNAATFGIGEVLSGAMSMFSVIGINIVLFFIGYYLISIVMWALIAGSIFLLYFRLIALIFSSYIKLIITIILGPFLLMFESVPGKSTFKSWFMGIVGNLIIYPIMFFIFVISYIIVFKTNTVDMTGRLPYFYGLDSNAFRVLIGIGLIFIIPDLVKAAKEALGIKDLPINIGVGTFFGGASSLVGGGVGLLGQIGSINLGLTALGLTGEKGIFGKKNQELLKKLQPNPPDAPAGTGGQKG